jgi:hypothetical protein
VTDAELDLKLQALGPVEPPRGVQARVLTAVGVSDARVAALIGPEPLPLRMPPARPRWRWPVAVASLAMAAAALYAVVPSPPERAQPDALVPRGFGDIRPSLGLRVAVRSSGQVERLRPGQAYQPGDTLLFRVSSSVPVDIVLRRGDAVLYRGAVPAGDTDLPVGYTLEAGEAAAPFVVEGSGAEARFDMTAVPR